MGNDTIQQKRLQTNGVAPRSPDGPAGEFAAVRPRDDRWTALRRDSLYRRSLIAADVTAALMAMVVAVQLLSDDRLRLATLLLAPIVVLTSKIMGLYDRDELLLHKATLDEAPALFQLATLYALGTVLLAGVMVRGQLGDRQVVALWILLFMLALLGRTTARALANRVAPAERCLLVGSGGDGDAIDQRLPSRQFNATLIGRLDLDVSSGHARAMDALERAVREHDAQRVILAPRNADSDTVLEAIRLIKSLDVKVSLCPRLFEVVGSSVAFDELDGLPVLGVPRFGLTRSSMAVKRATDVVGATLGLLAMAPVFVIASILIKLDSRGPVFFRQDRVGRDGEHFSMFKFRTMVANAEELKAKLRVRNESQGLFKITDDPRVTRIGRLLRATSLDELPQLVNVLRGDMSLVGPRPLVLDEDALVQGWDRHRLHLTPGMTGPWQLLGATKISLQDMVKIDYLYIANWSLWIDAKILLRTVAHMVRRAGM